MDMLSKNLLENDMRFNC